MPGPLPQGPAEQPQRPGDPVPAEVAALQDFAHHARVAPSPGPGRRSAGRPRPAAAPRGHVRGRQRPQPGERRFPLPVRVDGQSAHRVHEGAQDLRLGLPGVPRPQGGEDLVGPPAGLAEGVGDRRPHHRLGVVEQRQQTGDRQVPGLGPAACDPAGSTRLPSVATQAISSIRSLRTGAPTAGSTAARTRNGRAATAADSTQPPWWCTCAKRVSAASAASSGRYSARISPGTSAAAP
ncbi:hypothetical protein O1L60_08950 [Streptomyces diastatochromogenes]|nr:hypothetical protein [Streptomyces diastatochromogenes]